MEAQCVIVRDAPVILQDNKNRMDETVDKVEEEVAVEEEVETKEETA